jgi:hypothetical protein
MIQKHEGVEYNYSNQEKIYYTYHLAVLVRFTRIDMSAKINWENNSINLFFLNGRSSISSSNFARVATSANLISLVEKFESKDDRSSLIFLPVLSSLLYF